MMQPIAMILVGADNVQTVCPMHTEPIRIDTETLQKAMPFVFSDGFYQLKFPQYASNFGREFRFTVDINGESFLTVVSNDGDDVILTPYRFNARTQRAENANLFHNAFGLVQIQVNIVGLNQKPFTLYSDYLQVAMRETQATRDLKAMANFIKAHSYWFTHPDLESGIPKTLNDGQGHDELASHLRFIQKVIATYDEHSAYFCKHAKTKVIDTAQLDSYEKLRNFDARTLEFIVTHPEELIEVQSHSGIAINQKHYAPKHTLVNYRTNSKATPENLALMAFLKTLDADLRQLKKSLNVSLIKVLTQNEPLPDGYISSTEIIFDTLADARLAMLSKIDDLIAALNKTHLAYRHYLPDVQEPMHAAPALSPVFINDPHYRLFLNLMLEWFSMPSVGIAPNQSILGLLIHSRLYEYFAMTAMLETHLEEGFKLSAMRHYDYRAASLLPLYVETPFANTFEFESTDERLTVFVQPIIGGSATETENGLHLQRITHLTFDGKTSKNALYVPDFVLKFTNKTDGSEEYYIADAKYSTLETVKEHYASELAFKYLLSIRPTVPHGTLAGLTVLYGKHTEEPSQDESFWDCLTEDSPHGLPSFTAQGLFAN